MELDLKPVIVTSLFDIGRENWDNHSQSYSGYLHWMENLLKIDNPMVIYTQPKFLDSISKIRQNPQTKIITQEIESLPSYQKYNFHLTELMTSSEFVNKIQFPQVPEMSKPLYNIIMFNKAYWIKDTIDNGYFNGNYTLWLDAGGLRDQNIDYNIKWPNIEKLSQNKITFFSHNEEFTIPDKEYHSLSQIRNIQGTAFGVPNNLLPIWLKELDNTILESINQGYIGSDEKIFDISYLNNKDLFKLIKSSWREYFEILS